MGSLFDDNEFELTADGTDGTDNSAKPFGGNELEADWHKRSMGLAGACPNVLGHAERQQLHAAMRDPFNGEAKRQASGRRSAPEESFSGGPACCQSEKLWFDQRPKWVTSSLGYRARSQAVMNKNEPNNSGYRMGRDLLCREK